MQGPCYYPAGHLYHYMALNLIHMNTEHAERIVKLLHMLMHSFLICLTVKIAFIYFAEEKKEDQDDEETGEKSYDEYYSQKG